MPTRVTLRSFFFCVSLNNAGPFSGILQGVNSHRSRDNSILRQVFKGGLPIEAGWGKKINYYAQWIYRWLYLGLSL